MLSVKIKEMEEVIQKYQELEIDLFNERQRMKQNMNKSYEQETNLKKQKLPYNYQEFKKKEMEQGIRKYKQEEKNLFKEKNAHENEIFSKLKLMFSRMKQRMNELYAQEKKVKKQKLHYEVTKTLFFLIKVQIST